MQAKQASWSVGNFPEDPYTPPEAFYAWGCATHHGDGVNPGVQGVAGHPQVGLVEFVVLGPAERDVAQPLLDDGMEPGQEEVETGSLTGCLHRYGYTYQRDE